MQQFDITFIKIGLERGVIHGFGELGLRWVRGRSQGSTGEWLDEIGLGQRKSILSHPRRRTWFGLGAHRTRPGRCQSYRREDLVGYAPSSQSWNSGRRTWRATSSA